ncbi:hypothetical protein D9M69_695710 [compost metagenome]
MVGLQLQRLLVMAESQAVALQLAIAVTEQILHVGISRSLGGLGREDFDGPWVVRGLDRMARRVDARGFIRFDRWSRIVGRGSRAGNGEDQYADQALELWGGAVHGCSPSVASV